MFSLIRQSGTQATPSSCQSGGRDSGRSEGGPLLRARRVRGHVRPGDRYARRRYRAGTVEECAEQIVKISH